MSPALGRFGAAWLRLSALLEAAEVAQWQPGRVERPREDTTERSRGVTSDPTYAAASDERRLRLRVRVVEAERALELAGRNMQAAERHLAEALEEWHG